MLNLIYNKNPQEAQRLFHGRGKSQINFDFINIDYFPPVILITLYRDASSEIINSIQNQLLNLPGLEFNKILLQKRFLPMAPTESLLGDPIFEHLCEENNLKYSIKFGSTQNLGFFLDMKLGREIIQNNIAGKKVLNLFSYTCAFSVVAMKYGASEVVNMDMSKPALSRAKENHFINNLNIKNVKFFAHDILKSFGLIKRLAPFDFIIIDPPSDHGSHFKVDRDYPKLISRLKDWSSPGALVLTCLNSPFHSFNFLEECMKLSFDSVELLEKCGAPKSFAETDPERGLKIMLWRLP